MPMKPKPTNSVRLISSFIASSDAPFFLPNIASPYQITRNLYIIIIIITYVDKVCKYFYIKENY